MEDLSTLGHWMVSVLPRIAVAALCGLVLGYERHRRQPAVGMRTYALVCIGATAYIVSGHLILDLSGHNGDPTRIAGQIITGIGFLGAGAILRSTSGVAGLTSAAGIWFMGAVGVMIGCNYPLAALLLTLAVTALMIAIGSLERWLDHFGRRREEEEASPSGPPAV